VKRLAAVVGFAVLAGPLFAIEMPQPTPKSISIFRGSAAVEAMGSTGFKIKVDPDRMTQTQLVGRVTASGGSGNDIEVVVVTDADFVNWKNNHTTHPLFKSGQVTVADIDLSISGGGTYYLVFSNLFSAMTPKTISGHVDLKWIQLPSAAEIAAAQAQAKSELEQAQREQRNTILVALVALLVVGAALGGVVVWVLASRRAKKQAEAAK
jgi:hypothetical protein